MKGDPNTCKHCGQHKSLHDGILRDCPGHKYRHFESKFDGDGELKLEYTNEPVCPHCGYEDHEWWDYGGGVLNSDGDEDRRECCSCGETYDVTIHISYDFSTEIPDLEAEKLKKEKEEYVQKKRKEEYVQKKRNQEVREFQPGTMVRICKGTTIHQGRVGKVANKEVRWHDTLVTVEFDDGKDWYFSPHELERI